jgi:major membrane immunogen (membrane-anchored lipoprotein)
MFLAMLWAMFLLPACAQDAPTMHDGYYTAEAADFDAEGWKPFITICVSNNKIVTVEYNAKNVSGFIKSWDVDYMRRMRDAAGIYPSKYIRAYAAALLDKQNPALINVIPGSEKSHILFKILSEAVISQARTGDKSIVFITYPPTDLERLS